MRNIYRHEFICACPNNGKQIVFHLELHAVKTIMVEHIVTACALHKSDFHETIADALHARFGGYQVITAHHHGVDIETQRGAL